MPISWAKELFVLNHINIYKPVKDWLNNEHMD